ncbi:hypothetical protein F5X99DRAFT_413769 [Biscogniauxia marginata]|nr:hypothetical protein F5X99DRAFT_413769 [Biscogniauxia marginata]
MIDTPEPSVVKPEAIIIHVSREGIMNTASVIQASRAKQISGVTLKVFGQEPAGTEKDSAFLPEDAKDLNLTFSPHVGYFYRMAKLTIKSMAMEHVRNDVSRNYANFEA